MSSSEIVVKGEAIESDDDSDVEFPMTQSNKSLVSNRPNNLKNGNVLNCVCRKKPRALSFMAQFSLVKRQSLMMKLTHFLTLN